MEALRRRTTAGNRYLTFQLENETYCLEILKVKELLGMVPITPLPQTPAYIQGVINLRGQIIPILDLRLKFGLPFRDYHKRTTIIVAEVSLNQDSFLMGLVVDAIQEVISLPDEKINRIPYINARIRADYIQGVAETGDRLVILLDVVKVLTDEEYVQIQSLVQA